MAVVCPIKQSSQPRWQIAAQSVTNTLGLVFNPRNATEFMRNTFENRLSYDIRENIKVQFSTDMQNFGALSLSEKQAQVGKIYDHYKAELQALQLTGYDWRSNKQLVAIDLAFKNIAALEINNTIDYDEKGNRSHFGPSAGKSLMEDFTVGSPVKFVYDFNKNALAFLFNKKLPDAEWYQQFDDYFGKQINSDVAFLTRTRRTTLMKGLTGKNFGRFFNIIQTFAKVSAITSLVSYSVLAGVTGSWMAPIGLLTVGIMSAGMQLGYLKLDLLGNTKFSKKNRKVLYNDLGFKDEYFWYDTNPWIESVIKNRYVKKTAEFMENLIFRWGSGATIPDLLGAPIYRDRATAIVLDRYFDPTLSDEQNTENLRAAIALDPNLKRQVVGDIRDIAFAEAGRNVYRRGSITELGPLGTVFNLLGARGLLKWKGYMRHMFGDLSQKLYKQEIDKGNPDAELFYNMYTKNNAETGYAVAFTIHTFLRAWRIGKLLEGMDDPDEDDESIFKEMLSDGKAWELLLERGGLTNNYITAAFSNQYSRGMFELMELAFENMGRGGEKESFYDALQDNADDTTVDPDKVRTALFIKRKIDAMLRFIVPFYIATQGVADGYQNGWDQAGDAYKQFNDRYTNFMSSDMSFEQAGQKNYRSLVGELNIFLGSQNNQIKNQGMDIAQAGKFYNDTEGYTNPILRGLANSRLMGFIKNITNDTDNISMPDITAVIENNTGVRAILMQNDVEQMTDQERLYAFNQFTKNYGNYDINAMADGIAKTEYNKEQALALESILKKSLGDDTYAYYKQAIKDSVAAGGGYDSTNNAALLDLLARKQGGENVGGSVPGGGAAFFAYTLRLLTDEYAVNHGFSYAAQLNPADELAAKAWAFKQIAPAAIQVDAISWKNTANYVLTNRVPEMQQYFTAIDTHKNGDSPKDISLDSFTASELLYNAKLLSIRNLAMGKPMGEFYNDMIVPFAALLRNYDIRTSDSPEVKAEKLQTQKNIDHIFTVGLTQSLEMMKDHGYTNQQISEAFTPLFMQNQDKFKNLIDDPKVPQDIKDSVAKNLYGNFLNIVEQEAIVKQGSDGAEIKKNYFGENEFYYSPGTDLNSSGYRKLDFGGTGYYNSYGPNAKQSYTNYKQYYDPFKSWYLNNLNNTFKDYERTIFKTGGFEYNPQERAFLKARARYNKIVSDYPVFDFQQAGSRSFGTTIKSAPRPPKSTAGGKLKGGGGKFGARPGAKRPTTNLRAGKTIARDAGTGGQLRSKKA